VDEREILERINRLVSEEHALVGRGDHALSGEERERQQALEVALDQCWDLLRQRRARRTAGQDPEAAELRDPETVERYEQ
jgi:hypothetical protein